MSRKVVIFGGCGALGSKCVESFKRKNWWVGSIDYKGNYNADINVILQNKSDEVSQESVINKAMETSLKTEKLNAIICVAGGWKGGNAKKNLLENTNLMWKKSILPSLLSASLASKSLNNNGILILSGASAALEETPTMIGYGLAKNSVHHLCQSLASQKSGMPEKSVTIAILPTILDTEQNRKFLPNADFSSWTSLDFVSNTLLNWCDGNDIPKSGSLIKFNTNNGVTKLIECSL